MRTWCIVCMRYNVEKDKQCPAPLVTFYIHWLTAFRFSLCVSVSNSTMKVPLCLSSIMRTSFSTLSTCRQLITPSFETPMSRYMMHLHKCGPQRKIRKKKTATEGRPFIRGVVLKTLIKKPKKPNSANRKCVRVRLSNGREAVAYVPGIGHNLQEHHIVLVRGGRVQDLPGVKLKCVRGKFDLSHVKKTAWCWSRSNFEIEKLRVYCCLKLQISICWCEWITVRRKVTGFLGGGERLEAYLLYIHLLTFIRVAIIVNSAHGQFSGSSG